MAGIGGSDRVEGGAMRRVVDDDFVRTTGDGSASGVRRRDERWRRRGRQVPSLGLFSGAGGDSDSDMMTRGYRPTLDR